MQNTKKLFVGSLSTLDKHSLTHLLLSFEWRRNVNYLFYTYTKSMNPHNFILNIYLRKMMSDEGEIYKITHHMFRSEKIAQWRVLLCVQVRPTLLSVAELWIFNWNFKGFVFKKILLRYQLLIRFIENSFERPSSLG